MGEVKDRLDVVEYAVAAGGKWLNRVERDSLSTVQSLNKVMDRVEVLENKVPVSTADEYHIARAAADKYTIEKQNNEIDNQFTALREVTAERDDLLTNAAELRRCLNESHTTTQKMTDQVDDWVEELEVKDARIDGLVLDNEALVAVANEQQAKVVRLVAHRRELYDQLKAQEERIKDLLGKATQATDHISLLNSLLKKSDAQVTELRAQARTYRELILQRDMRIEEYKHPYNFTKTWADPPNDPR